MTPQRARALLGVGRDADPGTLRRAFGEAAKKLHPDRPGGDARRFREAVSAYQLLQTLRASALNFLPAVATPLAVEGLEITPVFAMTGGAMTTVLPDGRTVRLTLPPGLREGDKVRAAGCVLPVTILNDTEMAVRGDDVWLTLLAPARVMQEGGRLLARTPLGERTLHIEPKEAARRLIRRQGEGLPARGAHRQGDLFLRLERDISEPAREGSARALLRRFAAAWAA